MPAYTNRVVVHALQGLPGDATPTAVAEHLWGALQGAAVAAGGTPGEVGLFTAANNRSIPTGGWVVTWSGGPDTWAFAACEAAVDAAKGLSVTGVGYFRGELGGAMSVGICLYPWE